MPPSASGRALVVLIKWTLLATGPLMLTSALLSIHGTQSTLRGSLATQGTVVALKPLLSLNHTSTSYAPVFRFADERGHPVTVTSHTSSNPAAFKAGEAVKVRYQPGHPEDAIIDSFSQLRLGDAILGALGGVFTAFSLLVVLWPKNRNRPVLAGSDPSAGIYRR